jgi:UDP-N-acetylmuramoyl-L-alanyl-D-glutamate--2,6-diaminopimelate ligase
MRLDELLAGLDSAAPGEPPPGSDAVEIAGVAYDSRSVRAGDLFFCVKGFQSDGHDHAPRAVRAGAAALIVERPLGLGVPEVLVPSARAAMGPIATRFYGDPSRELRVVGVTGTNGKTTTAYLVRALLEAAGEQCALLGTVKSIIGGVEQAVVRTTPEAIDLQADLRAMLDGGDRACAMEVSSHALELGRVDGLHYAAAIFTNISRDHLDFHGTMEDYFLAKRRLFLPSAPRGERPVEGQPGASVINVGDAYGQRLAAEVPRPVTFAVESQADYSAWELRCDASGCAFELRTPAGARQVSSPMRGRFNVANALGALAAAHTLGADLDVLVGGLEEGVRVPGRFEPVDEGQDFAVLVDYAHTPDSLENVLRAARELVRAGEHAEGRVRCVFGAGGDRDRGKRPVMGEVARRHADVVLVTSDNPRSEDPEEIISEIMAGVRRVEHERAPGGSARSDAPGAADPEARAEPASSIVDRRAAIADAVRSSASGDVLVIAGKGHEQGQELAGGRKVPFDDVTVVREALRERANAAPARRAGGVR